MTRGSATFRLLKWDWKGLIRPQRMCAWSNNLPDFCFSIKYSAQSWSNQDMVKLRFVEWEVGNPSILQVLKLRHRSWVCENFAEAWLQHHSCFLEYGCSVAEPILILCGFTSDAWHDALRLIMLSLWCVLHTRNNDSHAVDRVAHR